MVFVRGLMALAAVGALAATWAGGCGGLSASDAQVRCNEEQMGKADCFDTNVYNSCVACFENCGDSCTAQEVCPEQYLCPGQTLIDAGSDAL